MKPFAFAALLLALSPLPAPAAEPAQAVTATPPGGALYVANAKTTLEQAFADVMLESFGPDGPLPFGVLALGNESRKLTLKGAKPPVRSAVQRLQQAGGRFYLCDRDLKGAGLAQKDLLPGVHIERALSREELKSASAQSGDELVKVRKTCSAI